jgi:hypothetical protein
MKAMIAALLLASTPAQALQDNARPVYRCLVSFTHAHGRQFTKTIDTSPEHGITKIALEKGWVFVDLSSIHQPPSVLEFGVRNDSTQQNLSVFGKEGVALSMEGSAAFGPELFVILSCSQK